MSIDSNVLIILYSNTILFYIQYPHHFSLKSKKSDLLMNEISSFLCLLHQQKVEYIQLKQLNLFGSVEDMVMIFICHQCHPSNVKSKDSLIPINNIRNLRQIFGKIYKIYTHQSPEIKDIKQRIISQMKQRFTRKSKYVSYFSLLTDKHQQFLLESDEQSKIFILQSQNKVCEIDRQKMCEMKKWMKNPELFERIFRVKLTKENLKFILSFKYSLMKELSILEQFLKVQGLNMKGLNFKCNPFKLTLILQDMGKFAKKVDQLIEKEIKHIDDVKLYTLSLIQGMINTETDIQIINKYMTDFTKLYTSIASFQPLTMFQSSQQSSKYFNFSIDQRTVVLRNPQLNFQKTYNQVTYEKQFAFINNGEYIFNNQYRPNYLCCEDKIDLQRSLNTMIGCEFDPLTTQQMASSWNHQGKIVVINSQLKSDKKMTLRLRLNSQEFDKITIKILWSTNWDNHINGLKDSSVQMDIQIVPDQGENRYLYGFSHKNDSKRSQIQLQKFNDLSQKLVLQDDIISLFLSQDQNSVICWNQTRDYLISQIPVKKPKLSFTAEICFQLQLYVGIVLYTTISEVQIYAARQGIHNL